MKYLNPIVALALASLLLLGGCSRVAAGDADPTQPTEEAVTFNAIILEVTDSSVLVEPLEGDDLRNSADRVTFGTAELPDINPQVGDYVLVTYDGLVMESYPAQVNPSHWVKLSKPVSPAPDEQITYSGDGYRMSLALPQGWQHHSLEVDAATGIAGAQINPQGQPDMSVRLEYHSSPVGICGTGVTFTDMVLAGGYTATACTELMGDGSYWFYLILGAPHEGYVVSCTVAHEIWAQYEGELLSILNTLELGAVQ